jgi:hypothetical protein
VRFLRAVSWLVVLLLAAVPAAASGAAVERPSWTTGDFWSYRTNTTLTAGLNLTGTATSTVAGTVPMDVGGTPENAFRVVVSGSGVAAGTVATSSGNVSVRGDWIATGEERFEPTGLHAVYSLLDLSVNGTYQSLVPFSIRVQNTTTFAILSDDWRYPLTVGGNGSVAMAYDFVPDVSGIGGTPFHQNGTGQWTLRFSLGDAVPLATPAGTFTAYPIVETWPDGSSERSWYAPQVGNEVRTETWDAGGNLTSDTALVAYRYQALETPRFLGLTFNEWAAVVAVAAIAVVAALLLLRRSRRKKRPSRSGGEAPPEVTSGPRGP